MRVRRAKKIREAIDRFRLNGEMTPFLRDLISKNKGILYAVFPALKPLETDDPLVRYYYRVINNQLNKPTSFARLYNIQVPK